MDRRTVFAGVRDATKVACPDRRVALAAIAGSFACGGRKSLRAGSKNFTEQLILGEIIAQHVEHRLGGDAAALRARVQSAYARVGLAWLPPLGIDNGFAMVVSGNEPYRTLSEAAGAAKPWVLGVGYEFEQRADGLGALNKTYGMKWAERPKTMDLGLLSKLKLKVLEDDRHAFPPYEVSIAARDESLREKVEDVARGWLEKYRATLQGHDRDHTAGLDVGDGVLGRDSQRADYA